MQGEGVEVVVMEATSHALALQKLEPLCFEAAIFTNLTPEHLDFHQTMQDYFAAKASLFTKAKLSILNADDAAARDLIPYCKGRVCLTSAGGHAVDYVATGVEFRGTRGVSYTMRAPHAAVQLSSPIPGIFTLSNTLQAAACAMELGIGARSVREGIGTLGGVKGRMEKVKLEVPLEIDVFLDYAHTPDALENVLRTARGFCRRNQRVVVLFGCGGDRDRSKRPRMGEIASRYADMIYVTSDNSRSERPQDIIANILEGISPQKDYKVIPDRALAIETAVLGAQRGDVIILAGKGHEAYEIDQTGKHPFDEKAIVRAAARRAYDWAHQQNKNEGE
jgi:UDP-N-acetylmuramoyl-L-alanyl-D-glutamate--2,6-diaminopimelate ligase